MFRSNKAKTIMIQGTASDVGKSIIGTALCRIFSNENNKVAPFKSWNMSLNSSVTPSGGEIGIAQAIQAQAARVKPEIDMQPILVKPRGDGLSQIVIRGRPAENQNYLHKNKNYIKKAKNIIKKSLDNLKDKFDIIVIEGAGSPTEVNRKKQDLANMMVAKLNNTPVILVADIDRGGALAALVGTVKLLEPEERKLIKGFIINRFRGDRDILQPGLEYIEDYTGIPILGVIPYLKDIKLPEEDAASLKRKQKTFLRDSINISIINLPRISNFTDFKSLELEPGVNLNYIKNPEKLRSADLIIIPGTKSTTSDLKYLKKSGLAAEIKNLLNKGIPLIGICGGFQMMGRKLLDPYHTEGQADEIKGLDIFPIETIFSKEKTTHQIKAEINNNGLFLKKGDLIQGYEIHMGETRYLSSVKIPFTIRKRSGSRVSSGDGALTSGGRCMGTYIHGLFNNDIFRHSLVNTLSNEKGLSPQKHKKSSFKKRLETDYDKLAAAVKNNLNMELLYSIIGDKVE
ncbi:MAG: cobyric acid synthase [Bacillota bacterium]